MSEATNVQDTNVVERKIREIVAERADIAVEEVTRDRRFEGDLPLDSLDVIEIVMTIEEVFDIDMPDEDTDPLATVGDAIDYVIEHTG